MTKTAILAAAAALLLAGAAQAQPASAPGDPAAMTGPTAQGAATGGHAHGRFAMMDADGDGKVTLAEFVAFSDKVFDRIDVAHKGQITKADVDAAIAQQEAAEAGRMTRGRGGRGGGGEEGQLQKLSARLADGGALTRDQWETLSAERFAGMDTAHLGYLTADSFGAMGGGRRAANSAQ